MLQSMFPTPPEGSVAIHFIGQGGVVLVSDQGTSVAIDPYLTNSVPLTRLAPIPCRPEDLEVAHVLLTHDHSDHTDPDTCIPLMRLREVGFWGPESSIRVLRSAGGRPDRLHAIARGDAFAIHDIEVQAVHAEHTQDSVGYILTVSGHTIYHTGDTTSAEELFWLHSRGVDVLLTVFAGRWEAMTAPEAAELADRLGVKLVIPMHFATFAENLSDPETLVQAVRSRQGCSATVRVLAVGERFVYPPGADDD